MAVYTGAFAGSGARLHISVCMQKLGASSVSYLEAVKHAWCRRKHCPMASSLKLFALRPCQCITEHAASAEHAERHSARITSLVLVRSVVLQV